MIDLVAVNMNGPHTRALVLSWVVFFLLAVVGFVTPGKRLVRRLVQRLTPGRTFLAAVAVVLALMGGCVANAIHRDGWNCYWPPLQANLPDGQVGCPAHDPPPMPPGMQ